MPYEPLRVLDGREQGWETKALQLADTKRNFVVILNQTEDIGPLCRVLECEMKALPERLERWGVHALADVLETKDFAMLRSVCKLFDVRLVEQIHLSRNSPPRVKPFILYCEARGIISDHDSLDQ